MRDLYFEIVENGYHIYDRNDEFFHIYQPEPYIPDLTKSYEENAQISIKDIIAHDYARMVFEGSIAIEDVPEEYREKAAAIVKLLEMMAEEESEDATEQDYINALAELGVTDDEENNA